MSQSDALQRVKEWADSMDTMIRRAPLSANDPGMTAVVMEMRDFLNAPLPEAPQNDSAAIGIPYRATLRFDGYTREVSGVLPLSETTASYRNVLAEAYDRALTEATGSILSKYAADKIRDRATAIAVYPPPSGVEEGAAGKSVTADDGAKR